MRTKYGNAMCRSVWVVLSVCLVSVNMSVLFVMLFVAEEPGIR